ncbi:MAG: hypothetical protein ACRC0F_00340 [Cetobacterium sp.]
MSNTTIILLKILLHGEIHIDEIVKYIKLDVNSIERNISILDEYLKEKGMSRVIKNNNRYSLENNDKCFADFFSKLDILTSDNRKDIYCIRTLLDGYINLEKERQKIGVSRTTAVKDFKVVREMLQMNNIFLESRNSKGIFLKGDNKSKVTEILCENLTKLFIDRDFLSMQRKELLKEIDILDEEKYVKIYKKITETFEIRKSMFSFYAIYSMALIEKHKGEIVYEENGIEDEEDYKNIMVEFEKLEISKELSKEMKKFVVIVILKLRNYKHLKDYIKDPFKNFLKEIKYKFKMEDDEVEKLEKFISNYFLIGCLNKKYGVLWIRKAPESLICRKLAQNVQEILDSIGVEMIYSDMLRLSSSISKFFMNNIYVEGFKVMSVSRNLDENYNIKVMKAMKEIYTEVEFYSESFLEFKFHTKEEMQKYNFIVSDTESYKIKNLKKVNELNIREVERCFIEYALEKIFERVESL